MMATVDELRVALGDRSLLGRQRAAEALAADGSPQAAGALAEAIVDGADEAVAAVARRALADVCDQAAVDEVCRVWATSGNEVLGGLIAERAWVASGPPEVRVRTALHIRRPEALAADGPDVVAPLVALAANDVALRVLIGLTDPAARQQARQRVCQAVIDGDHPAALAAVVAASFEPADDTQRALLWLLAGEWERYRALDVDGSLLSAAYAAADPDLRTRLAAQARYARRPELAPALVGGCQRRRLSEMTDAEWEVALGVLSGGRRTDDLWALALEAPPRWGARILGLLARLGWQPPTHSDRGPYAELQARAQACPAGTTLLGTLTEHILTLDTYSLSVVADEIYSLNVLATPDGSLLVSGWDGKVRLWSLPDGRLLATLRGSIGAAVHVLAAPRDGSLLATGGFDGKVRLWSLPDGRPLATLRGRAGPAVAFNPDGSLLATGGLDGKVQLWSLPDGRRLATLHQDTRWAHSVTVAPDGSLLATGGVDAKVRLWSLPDGRPLATLRGRAGPAVAFNPDGSLLATGGLDGKVQLWSLPDGRRLSTLHQDTGRVTSLAVTPLAVTPDGSLLVSSGLDGKVRLWSLPDGRRLSTLHQDTGSVTSLAVTPDGSLLATGGLDGKVQLWGSALDRLWRAPQTTIGARDTAWLEEIVRGDLSYGERRWAELILGFVRFRLRHELGAVEEARVTAGEFDIEIGG